ncbi:STAS domain-containing protein [Actinomadura kijaniata]|uniref:STAS domain-containing protein n=1 Tax=Actinomadura kijaniata TaxID=46161 RepID=UPI003F1D715A
MTDDNGAAGRPGRRRPGVRCRPHPAQRQAPRPAQWSSTQWPSAYPQARPALPVRDVRELGEPGDLRVVLARAQGDTAVAAVSGEIDLRTADTLRTRLTELHTAGFRRLVVDFAEVSFCDATGLGALVAVHNLVREQDGGVRLVRVRPAQLKLLRVTGLHRLFVTDRHDAADAADAPAPSPRP